MKKTIISFLTSVVVLSMLIMTPVKAAENTVAFTSQNDQVVVTLNVTDTSKEALSLKASFQIKALTGEIKQEDVQFIFDEHILSAVKEYRYGNGVLTIYISGEEDLLNSEQVELGAIALNLSNDTQAEISLADEGIEWVSSAAVKDVLAVSASNIQVGGTAEDPSIPSQGEDEGTDSKPSDDEVNDSESSTEEQVPSVDVTEDDTENTGGTSSEVPTGDSAPVLVYVYLAVMSLVMMAYIAKRIRTKRQ